MELDLFVNLFISGKWAVRRSQEITRPKRRPTRKSGVSWQSSYLSLISCLGVTTFTSAVCSRCKARHIRCAMTAARNLNIRWKPCRLSAACHTLLSFPGFELPEMEKRHELAKNK